MAGSGTYISFDKKRVGVYTKFVAKKPSDFINADTTGIVSIGLPMDWGKDGEITEVLGTDIENGNCLSKIGYSLNDEEILPYRLALHSAYKAYFYKLNSGGVKANATIGDIKAEAKYTGIAGNNIKVVITANTPTAGKFMVDIYYRNSKRETYYVANATELLAIESQWVSFSSTEASPTITATTGTTLANGTNGTIGADAYENFGKAIRYKLYDYLAICGTDTTANDWVVEFVNKEITRGKYVSGVVYNKPLLNNKYIISVDQGLECEGFTITTALMPIFIASMRAGCGLGQNLDDHDMQEEIGAIKIINEVEDDDNAVIAKLNQGCFFFVYLNDGTVVVEEDINTFVEYSQNDPADYRRNRLISTQNYIGNHIYLFQNKQVLAKSMADDDSQVTRGLIKSDLDTVCSELADKTVIRNYNPVTDIRVDNVEGKKSELVTMTHLEYLDSLRKIYNEFTIVLEKG